MSKELSKIKVNKFLLIYIFILILFKLSTPYGDEPDFEIRSYNISSITNFIYDTFSYSNNIQKLTPINNCISQNINFFWYKNDIETCVSNTSIFLKRLILQILFLTPLLLSILIINKFDFSKLLKERAIVCFVSLFYSGSIYYTGLLSHESFTATLSLMIFLFWKNPIIVSILVLLVAMLDNGNAMVLIIFLIIFSFINIFNIVKVRNYLLFSFILILIFVLLSSLFSKQFLSYVLYESSIINYIPYRASEYLMILEQHHFNNLERFSKYYIFFRPIITILTSIYFTAYKTTVLPVIIIYFGVFIYLLSLCLKEKIKIDYMNQKSFENLILFLTVISTILVVTITIPAYCNAKYFIFMTPFVINFFKDYIDLNKILNFLILMSLLIIFFLRLYLY